MFVIVWEFIAKSGREAEFEQVYGRQGDWARFFSKGEGYVRTELHRDTQQANRYLTLDFWTSEAAYQAFRSQHAQEYLGLDRRSEALTERETCLGTFLTVD